MKNCKCEKYFPSSVILPKSFSDFLLSWMDILKEFDCKEMTDEKYSPCGEW